jgi:hypothetical protein
MDGRKEENEGKVPPELPGAGARLAFLEPPRRPRIRTQGSGSVARSRDVATPAGAFATPATVFATAAGVFATAATAFATAAMAFATAAGVFATAPTTFATEAWAFCRTSRDFATEGGTLPGEEAAARAEVPPAGPPELAVSVEGVGGDGPHHWFWWFSHSRRTLQERSRTVQREKLAFRL